MRAAITGVLPVIRTWLARLRRPGGFSPHRHAARPGGCAVDLLNDPDTTARVTERRAEGRRPRLDVSLLGQLRVTFGARTLDRWPSRKGRFLFAYLAIHHGKRATRDALMEMFWPHSCPRSARNCLNVTLHGVRHLLKTIEEDEPIILYEGETYFINPSLDIRLDVDTFESAWEEGRRRERQGRMAEALSFYGQAASLYAGDLLEASPYEDWLSAEREHLREVYLVVLDKISRHLSLDGDPDGAIGLCERMLEKDRCQEEVHRRLMLCYDRLGFREKALKQYQRCAAILRKELDVEPTAETLRLYERIKGELPPDPSPASHPELARKARPRSV
jgi:DNA-binding SARP family transcriptional activator